jgi:non-homologous end joining protein Ku
MNAFPALEDQMCEFDPVYFDSSYYLYPDGRIAVGRAFAARPCP